MFPGEPHATVFQNTDAFGLPLDAWFKIRG